MSLYPELDNLDLTKLINCFHKIFPDGENDNCGYFGEVALRIRQHGKAGIDFLCGELDRANLEQLRGIILALTFPPPVEHPSLRDLVLSYLCDRRPLIIADAVDALRFLGATDTVDAVLPLRNHPDPYVRGSVLRFISHLFPLSAPPLLLEALQDPHYIVRENAIDELDELGAIEAIPDIRPFLSDPHPDVVQAARAAISNLEEALAG